MLIEDLLDPLIMEESVPSYRIQLSGTRIPLRLDADASFLENEEVEVHLTAESSDLDPDAEDGGEGEGESYKV